VAILYTIPTLTRTLTRGLILDNAEFESIIRYIFTVDLMLPTDVAVPLSRVSVFMTSVLLTWMNYRIYYVNMWCLWMMPCHHSFNSASVCLLCAIIASSVVYYFIIVKRAHTCNFAVDGAAVWNPLLCISVFSDCRWEAKNLLVWTAMSASDDKLFCTIEMDALV